MLDIKMPGLDGIETLRQIKASTEFSHIPVAMLSADTTRDTRESCREHGCSGYLTKPAKLDELHNILQECIFSKLGWKRRHIRVQHNLKATVTHKGESSELYTESVSSGGVFLRKKEPLPIGAELDILLKLDEQRALELKGTVIYTKGLYGNVFKIPPGMAVEFMDMETDDASVLADHVSKIIAADVFETQEEAVIAKSWN